LGRIRDDPAGLRGQKAGAGLTAMIARLGTNAAAITALRRKKEDDILSPARPLEVTMSGKTKVLIIDDDPAICESVKAILEGNGYAADTALSGKSGLEKFKATAPDIVLCDMMMEDIDSGIKIAAAMRAERKDIPLFLLSSIGDVTAENIGISQIGYNGVFQKPVDFDALLTVLGTVARTFLPKAD